MAASYPSILVGFKQFPSFRMGYLVKARRGLEPMAPMNAETGPTQGNDFSAGLEATEYLIHQIFSAGFGFIEPVKYCNVQAAGCQGNSAGSRLFLQKTGVLAS